MRDVAELIPMRWPGGPAELARRKKLTPAAREAFERWQDPSVLSILKGTQVNCLIVTWAAGGAGDAAQQRALAPFVSAAKSAGLTVIGWVDEGADKAAAIASARTAGLDALMMQSGPAQAALPVLTAPPRDKIDWRASGSLLAVSDNVWPGVQRSAGARSGATGIVWLDSNGWFLRLARSRRHSGEVWLFYDPPEDGAIVRPDAYAVAVADSGAHGGRWVLSLDDNLRAALASGQAQALETWKRIAASAAFFDRRREWRAFRPNGIVAVISDFSGPNEDLSTEILNLMARRQLPYRILDRSAAPAAPLAGLQAALCLDAQRPERTLERKLLGFAESGGLLVIPKSWPAPASLGAAEAPHPRFDVRRFGKGRIAIASEDSPDPYLVAGDVHILLSHANDLLRIYNVGSTSSYYTGAPDGKSDVLHLINYGGNRRGGDFTVWLRKKYGAAKMFAPGSDAPTALPLVQENRGVEARLSGLPGYTALEFTL